jgi:uncharacterized lipoprotein
MRYLVALVLLFLLSGCSDDPATSDDMSDLKQYVEAVNSRRPIIEPEIYGDPPDLSFPVFTPDDNPFDPDRKWAWSRTDEPDGKGGEFP